MLGMSNWAAKMDGVGGRSDMAEREWVHDDKARQGRLVYVPEAGVARFRRYF